MFLTVYNSRIFDNWSKHCNSGILLEEYMILLFGYLEKMRKMLIAFTVIQHWDWNIVLSLTTVFHQNELKSCSYILLS